VAPRALAERAYRILREHASALNIVRIKDAAEQFGGAASQLAVNLACIVSAVIVTLSLQRRFYRRRRQLSRASRRPPA
jgi:hypothetical protein